AGLVYRFSKNIYAAGAGEIVGTGLLGALISVWIVGPVFMGKQMAAATLVVAFSVSTIGGTIVGLVALRMLQKAKIWQP
ncbi:MAG TPA: hypothetical protein ENN79_09090, partial [Desulfobacteraceae bacterium]|nr:hypothetical protein [Desulfobacteraceae bacterium]